MGSAQSADLRKKSICIWRIAGSVDLPKVPHHSTFSENRLHRFRESDVFRHIFERVVTACMAVGLVKGEGFAVDASVMEANASRYHGKAPEEIVWAEPERQTRAVREYLCQCRLFGRSGHGFRFCAAICAGGHIG